LAGGAHPARCRSRDAIRAPGALPRPRDRHHPPRVFGHQRRQPVEIVPRRCLIPLPARHSTEPGPVGQCRERSFSHLPE
jgi:hypothetical protein